MSSAFNWRSNKNVFINKSNTDHIPTFLTDLKNSIPNAQNFIWIKVPLDSTGNVLEYNNEYDNKYVYTYYNFVIIDNSVPEKIPDFIWVKVCLDNNDKAISCTNAKYFTYENLEKKYTATNATLIYNTGGKTQSDRRKKCINYTIKKYK